MDLPLERVTEMPLATLLRLLGSEEKHRSPETARPEYVDDSAALQVTIRGRPPTWQREERGDDGHREEQEEGNLLVLLAFMAMDTNRLVVFLVVVTVVSVMDIMFSRKMRNGPVSLSSMRFQQAGVVRYE